MGLGVVWTAPGHTNLSEGDQASTDARKALHLVLLSSSRGLGGVRSEPDLADWRYTVNIKPDDAEHDLEEEKTMKIQLSKRHHIRLHSLKILTGRTISEITGEALERYYDEEDDVEAKTAEL